MWYKEYGGVYQSGNKLGFVRNKYIPYEASSIEKIKKEFNNQDVYITAYNYTDPLNKENSLLYAPFYLDFDYDIKDDNEYNKIKLDVLMILGLLKTSFNINSDQIMIYFSGNKGFHLFIPPTILGIIPKKKLNEDFKLLATKLNSMTQNKTIDTRIYDNARLIRIANTINLKSGLYKVRISENILREYTYEQIKKYAKKVREDKSIDINKINYNKKANNAYKTFIEQQKILEMPQRTNVSNKVLNLEACLPCVLKLLETGASIGNRNNCAVAIASSLFQMGGTIEEVSNLLIDWNYEKNDQSYKRVTETEIRNTVLSAYQRYRNNQIYGCTTFKELGYCVGNLCSLFRG